jgi:hypothetical protein
MVVILTTSSLAVLGGLMISFSFLMALISQGINLSAFFGILGTKLLLCTGIFGHM